MFGFGGLDGLACGATMSACASAGACRASRSGYTSGCRGPACTEAERLYQRARKRAKIRPDAVPTPARVPTGQVRTHIDELRAVGVGYTRIAQLAGVKPETVRLISKGRQRTCTPEMKDRLLAVMPSMVAPHALVDAGPTQERLESLAELGWSEQELAVAIYGKTVKAGQGRWRLRLIWGQRRLRRRTEDEVRKLYEEEFPPELEGDGDPLATWRLMAEPAEWRADAECLRLAGDDRARSQLFFPTRGEPATAARAVCERCPVAEPCLDFALDTAAQGIWGATTGGERRLIRRLGWTAAETFAAAMEHEDTSLIDLIESILGRAVEQAA